MSKKLCVFYAIFVFVFLVIIHNMPYFYNSFYADNDIYYRVTSPNTTLYRQIPTSYDKNEIYFDIPQTYFIKYISNENNTFLKVEYNGIIGYIEADKVSQVYSTPTAPYPDQTFSILNTANPVVYSRASTDSNFLGTIPYTAEAISLLGTVTIDDKLWYFCKYTSIEQGVLLGYIDSKLTQNLTPLTDNTEIVATEPIKDVSAEVIAPELKNNNTLFMIIGLSLLAILLLFLVFKPKRHTAKREAKRQITALNKLQLNNKNSNDELDF